MGQIKKKRTEDKSIVLLNLENLNKSLTWSTWLYLAMSLCKVLSMIIATIPDRKRTMTKEFMMLDRTCKWSQHQ